ncbi:cellulose synthase [Streptosporangium sp. NBC_01755]|uniref:cellulose synthase n=1 Tax=unclassified Streptosporangium TaxID=2632669 RepID=UPI002DD7FAF4|nr:MULTISPECIES: cellulose synthase [unclassified Streptosporangium]WSA29100.1 cellulose synthase [Streptosporangium sp. NBC_01810]WSC99454.1 cellulose synthase [Streptosporangium sp. NBC_01755]
MSFDQIAWLPLCAGVTGVGLVLSFLLMRRRGVAAGLRAAAWSLLPVAAFLTGALPTLWQIGTAIIGFFAGLVFNPVVWSGVAVTGLAVVLFLVSGFLRGRRLRAVASPAASVPAVAAAGPGTRGRTAAPAATAATQPLPKREAAPAPTSGPDTSKPAAKPAADDDFSDIEDILKRRGIG